MIEIKNMVAVGGLSGVYKLISARNNGIIIEDYDTKDRKFVPARQHQFSPFETVSVYTDTDSVPVGQVLHNMKANLEEFPVPSEKASSPELRNYLIQVLPEHDRDRVHISDIKKLIKWFNFLNSRNLLIDRVEEVKAEATEEAAEKTEN
jgi:spore coat protein CotF